MKELVWYGVLGNHDYNHSNLELEFNFYKDGWRIYDFFYDRTVELQNGLKIGFVHIDTNLLAYGRNGEARNKCMKRYFKKYRWTEEYILV